MQIDIPTMRLRVRPGAPGTLIPPNLGIEQMWVCEDGQRSWKEWRPLPVVPHDVEYQPEGD